MADIKNILSNNPEHIYHSQANIRDMQKDVKKRVYDMNKMTNSTYAKFLSVYRFKTPKIDDYEFSTSIHYYKRDLTPIKENKNKLMNGVSQKQ
jgi:hypothetical protein